MFINWFKQLDQLLKGETTSLSNLKSSELEVSTGGLVVMIMLMGMFYGASVGVYSLTQSNGVNYMQIIASSVKMPYLFLLTLAVTFPSLYVFNALIGSRLSIAKVLQIMLMAIATILAVLSSLGTIVLFFSLSTTSYPFMVILNVIVCSIGGIIGLNFLLRTLDRIFIIQEEQGLIYHDHSTSDTLSPLDKITPNTRQKAIILFRIWVFVFALVGSQMSWVLRPFIGSPHKEFTWFRVKESNFFIKVFESLMALFN